MHRENFPQSTDEHTEPKISETTVEVLHEKIVEEEVGQKDREVSEAVEHLVETTRQEQLKIHENSVKTEQETAPAEKQPQGDSEVSAEKNTGSKEEIKSPGVPISEKESLEKAKSFLNSENKDVFETMSEGGRYLAGKLYEGLSHIPGVKWLTGKLGIAYNQFWMDAHEEKAVALKTKMDGYDLASKELDTAKEGISSRIEVLKKTGEPGAEALLLALKKIDQEKAKISGKKDTIQSKFEYRDNKVKSYANERDGIAERLIGHYDEKLEPMEKELKTLEVSRKSLETAAAQADEEHKKIIAKVDEREQTAKRLAEILSTKIFGFTVLKGVPVKILEELSIRDREKIQEEKEYFIQRKIEIDAQIAKMDAKANPYRDTREEFVRVTKKRPIEMKMPLRTKGELIKHEEEVTGYSRQEGLETSSRENEENVNTASFVNDWNTFLLAKYGQYNLNLDNTEVDPKDFIGATGLNESSKSVLKEKLGDYYRSHNISENKFNESIDEFLNKK